MFKNGTLRLVGLTELQNIRKNFMMPQINVREHVERVIHHNTFRKSLEIVNRQYQALISSGLTPLILFKLLLTSF
jgi:hypothetical protein